MENFQDMEIFQYLEAQHHTNYIVKLLVYENNYILPNMGALNKKIVDTVIESKTIILHYSITVLLTYQHFNPSWEVAIEVFMSVVMTTVLKLHDNMYLLLIRIWEK